MKRTMNTIVVVVCALVIALFTTSCSKDNDMTDAEKNAIQAPQVQHRTAIPSAGVA